MNNQKNNDTDTSCGCLFIIGVLILILIYFLGTESGQETLHNVILPIVGVIALIIIFANMINKWAEQSKIDRELEHDQNIRFVANFMARCDRKLNVPSLETNINEFRSEYVNTNILRAYTVFMQNISEIAADITVRHAEIYAEFNKHRDLDPDYAAPVLRKGEKKLKKYEEEAHNAETQFRSRMVLLSSFPADEDYFRILTKELSAWGYPVRYYIPQEDMPVSARFIDIPSGALKIDKFSRSFFIIPQGILVFHEDAFVTALNLKSARFSTGKGKSLYSFMIADYLIAENHTLTHSMKELNREAIIKDFMERINMEEPAPLYRINRRRLP